MSREIKFRAWDIRFERMVDEFPEGYSIALDGRVEVFHEDMQEFITSVEYELMQYIGLKDANGVEIYEGDVDLNGRVFEYDTAMGGWYLMRNGEGVQWHAQCLTHSGTRLPFTIIGNIHENPELLEADQ